MKLLHWGYAGPGEGVTRDRCDRDRRVVRFARQRDRAIWSGPGRPPAAGAEPPRDSGGRATAVYGQHPLHQHHPRRRGATVCGQSGDRAADPQLGALERAGYGRACQSIRGGNRRSHLDLRVSRDALRGGVQPLLPRADRERRGRSRLLPGPCDPWHLCPRLSRRSPLGRAAGEFQAGAGSRRWCIVVSPSLADARVLAVPHRVDGPGTPDGDLPGALQSLPRGSRVDAALARQGVGLHRGRRDG